LRGLHEKTAAFAAAVRRDIPAGRDAFYIVDSDLNFNRGERNRAIAN
jgi:hypothetical protein